MPELYLSVLYSSVLHLKYTWPAIVQEVWRSRSSRLSFNGLYCRFAYFGHLRNIWVLGVGISHPKDRTVVYKCSRYSDQTTRSSNIPPIFKLAVMQIHIRRLYKVSVQQILMPKLTPKRVGILLWILGNSEQKWSIYELCKSAGTLDYSATHTFVKELEKAGFVTKMRGKYGISNARGIVNSVSYFQPIKSRERENFFVLGDMKKKMDLLKAAKMDHAFTIFAAGELLHPYVKTEDVHAYIRKDDRDGWKNYLIAKNARRAPPKEANLVLLPVADEYYFRLAWKVKNYRVASIGVVLADLLSYGGLGEGQAQLILDEWLGGRLNV